VAGGDEPLSPRTVPAAAISRASTRPFRVAPAGGVAAALFIVLAVAAALGGLMLAGGEGAGAHGWLWQATRFTLLQAGLSALLATACAIPVARALTRRGDFPGRALVLRLMTLPLVLPTLSAVMGIVSAWGSAGWLNRLLATLGLDLRLPLYGLTGILIAHVFFNMPLAVRLLLQAWDAVPGETWRLAAQLGMDRRAIFRLVEWPLLRRHAPGIAGLIFLLCATSFTPVLTLGGGPAATTLEVAIYQALRFDFAPGLAAHLALLQLAVCGGALMLWQALGRPMAEGTTLGRTAARPDEAAARVTDAVVLSVATLFMLLPLVSLLADGLGPAMLRVMGEAAVWRAAALSFILACGAAALSLALGAGLLGARWRALVAPLGFAALTVPPFVLGTGWFILLRSTGNPLAFAPLAVIAANALMTLPYVVRSLEPALARSEERYGRLAAALGMRGWSRFRLVTWPGVRRAFALSLGLCLALSLGDLGAAALFGSSGFTTLPLLLYQRMGSYRGDEAAALALLLAVFCLLLFALADMAGKAGRDD
jgi:thiamine transport system permease protein